MKARTFASVAVMTALGLLAPIHAHAFGLGKIELSSSLNEPFKAEIAVTALRGDDEGDLQVQLASNAEFEKAGLKRSFLLTQLTFEIVENNGETKIKISSPQAVREPFIDFLLTATTGNGRLIREYTVLLDPPKNVFAKSTPAPQKPKVESVKTKAKSTPQKSTYKYPDPEMPTSTNYSSATSYGPVEHSDTLTKIAKETKPSSDISLNQMMMAILNANPEAFARENINGLKAGYTLAIPSRDEIQALSKNQAYAAVKQQHDLWKNRNRIVAEAPQAIDQENTSIPSDNSTDGSDIEKNVSDTTGNGDNSQLQLVDPHDESSSEMDELAISGNKELTQISEQLTLAQETIESQTQENIDIKSRMDMMEEQLHTLRRLITLKDADLARMQSSLDGESIELAMTEAASTEAEITEAEPTEAEITEAESTEAEITEAESTEAEMTEAASTEAEKTEVESIEPEMGESEIEELTPAQSEVEAYFSQIGSGEPLNYDDEALVEETNIEHTSEMESDTSTKLPLEVAGDFINSSTAKVKAFYSEHKKESLIGGLAAALLALILLLFRRKRSNEKLAWDDAATTVVSDSEQTDTVEEQEPEAVNELVDESETPTEKTDEDIIMDAYASIEDIDVASENQEETISELEQEELNITEEINNNLEELNVSEVDEPLESEQETMLDLNDDLSVDTANEEETSLDFNTDELTIEPVAEEISEPDSENSDDLLDFNIDTTNSGESETLEIDELVTDNADNDRLDFGEPLSLDIVTEDDNELDLDDGSLSLDIDGDLLSDISLDDSPISFELPEEAESDEIPTLNIAEENETPEVADLSEVLSVAADESVQEESDVEFDLGDFDEIDEAETKLDLAGAYMDMGDPEGARNILEEVIIDGDDAQKSRAQSLLNDLS